VLLVLAGIVVAAGCSSAGDEDAGPASRAPACEPAALPDGESEARVMEVDGHEREYVVHVPPGYDGRVPAPLILNLHGFGGTIEQQDDETDLPAAGGERGYVVVTPQGLPISIPSETPVGTDAADLGGLTFWNFFGSSGVEFGPGATVPGIDPSELGVDDVAFFDALLDQVESDLCIDPDRVYSTGMSNGAGMSTTLACELGDRFDAIAPVSGVNLTGACPGDEPMSVRAIHGDADTVASYGGDTLMGFQLGNPSVPERMGAWAQHDGCAPEPETAEDGNVTIQTWDGCEAGTTVQLWTIHGWGHDWPRAQAPDQPGTIDATAVVLDFFDEQGRN
jgi:polyhydroxybutyrate depolymerase